MSDALWVIALCILTAMLGWMIGVIQGLSDGQLQERALWHKVAVERGLAQFCPKDGQWNWVGECKE